MRPATYLVGFLAAASAAFAVPDISGLPRQIATTTWTGPGLVHTIGRIFSDEEFCKIDNVYPRTETKAWWVGGVFPFVCARNHFSWQENRIIMGKWATWMDEKCGGHNIGVKHGTGKMCKRQP
ncbi:hypothetical protein D6D05_00209 [Aureobasidium pullulans]|nr:hypothetical protein D6D05_00209 [Aureobasidium pullulans]